MPLRIMKSDEARTHWRALLDIASGGDVDIVIERNGKSVAAVVSYENYSRTKALLEELRSIQNADEAVQEWLKNPERGRPYSEMREQLVSEGILE